MTKLDKIRASIENDFYAGEIDNAEVVKLMQLGEELLQLKTVLQYSELRGISPLGVYKCRKDRIIEVAGKKFVIDND